MIGKFLCAGVVFGAVMLLPTPPSGEHIKKVDSVSVRQQVQAEAPRKEPTLARDTSILMTKQEKTLTEPEASMPESTARQVKPAVPSNKQGCEQYRHLFEQYNWPVNTALAICQAESSGNIQATNWGDNHGKCKGSFSLMQVGCFWYTHYGYTAADRYNPEVNVKIAYQIYERQKSFKAWTTYTGGRYLKFL